MQITVLGIDLAKNVLQLHGVDDQGNVVVRKQLRVVRICGCVRIIASHSWPCQRSSGREHSKGSDARSNGWKQCLNDRLPVESQDRRFPEAHIVSHHRGVITLIKYHQGVRYIAIDKDLLALAVQCFRAIGIDHG